MLGFRPAPGVRLWRADLDACTDAGLTPPGADRGYADRDVLLQILARELGRPAASLNLARDEFGRPRLVGGSPIDFNMSRSDSEALIAVSSAGQVGVDVERVRPVIDVGVLVETQFSDEERAAWLGRDGTERDAAFLTVWTRKEACVKALGIGLRVPLAALDCGCLEDRRRVEVEVGDGRCDVEVVTVPIGDRSIAAVATTTFRDAERARRFFRWRVPSHTARAPRD